ncbi:MAG: 6,7-dimethyl-8-ribityllumazine synthase [candidate division Zixibacteria bacterium]|nr:6,7-dimethyl-8-ribityllumazine synthase [candidate division Zixibacteria bacterium]MBU1471928.1 6,7-dimethyl-8-ribityllumazine synthase [candidate division Zixibacteria bacterium]MBU2626109.1 6,7-dimethyl-8-ribityllumazine synthase [candidate division Zixibacteria bacterium]
MSKVIEGTLDAAGLKIGIVVSRFNDLLTNKLTEGAIDCLVRHKANEEDITVVKVPGAFELPYVAARLVEAGNVDAVICLGAVIRGQTPHFDYIAAEVSKGIANLSIQHKTPVIYGLITADTLEQAIERAGTKAGNRGFNAALTAIEMCNLYKQMNI